MQSMAERAIEVARAWVGTPYIHQASALGSGTDCLGLIRGIWRTLYGNEPECAPAYTADWGEAGQDELLMQAAIRNLVSVQDDAVPQVGEVLLFRMRDGAVAKHLGIRTAVGANASFIHAYDRHGVVESPLSAPWAARIAARFCWPEVR